MNIQPEVFTTPDRPIVRLREFRGNVDLDTVISRLINAQGWGGGTYFSVQFMNHERTRIFSTAEFIVTQEDEALVTSNPDSMSPNTKMILKVKAERITEWFNTSFLDERDPKNKIVEKINAEVKWNPGVKKHQVIQGGEVIFESDDKAEVDDFMKSPRAKAA